MLNFPSAPMAGTLYPNPPLIGVPQYVFDGAAWVASDSVGTARKNYFINGAMMISQENGTTAGSANPYYPVDCFYWGHLITGTVTAGQVMNRTPGGSTYRMRVTVTSPDASITGSDYGVIQSPIEAVRMADLKWGTADAKTVTLRFGCKGPAGKYGISIRNFDVSRNRIEEFEITPSEANTDVVKTLTIPGDVTGAWKTDNSIGMSVLWSMMVSSGYQGAAGAWGTGNFFGTSNQFNFAGTAGNVFELFDVGLYEGATAPAFVVPDYASELRACMRYYFQISPGVMFGNGSLRAGVAASYWPAWATPAPLRSSPTVVFGTLTAYCGDVSAAVSALSATVTGQDSGFITLAPTHGALASAPAGGAVMLYPQTLPVKFNARLA